MPGIIVPPALSGPSLSANQTWTGNETFAGGSVFTGSFKIGSGTLALFGWPDAADPTGISLSTTAIQNKLSVGGDVWLGPGTFLIDQILTLPTSTGVRFRGAGQGRTIIKAAIGYAPTQVGGLNGANMLVMAGGTGGSNVSVEDITFDQNQANVTAFTAPVTEANSHCVDLRGVTNLNVERVEVINPIRWSIHSLRSTIVRVASCRILSGQTSGTRSQQDGIHLTECSRFRVLNNDIDTGTTGDGDDCIALRSATSGFPAYDGVVEGNILQSGARAIALVSAGDEVRHIDIGPNVIRGTRQDGIILNWISGSSLFRDIKIGAVVMHDICSVAGHGIHLQNAAAATDNYDTVSIEGPTIRSFLNTSGFMVYCGQGKHLSVKGITASDMRGVAGIKIGDTSRPVVGFVCSDHELELTAAAAAANGIFISRASDGTVSNSYIEGATLASSTGVQLRADASNGCTDVIVNGNRTKGWATGIAETNGGANPDFNVITSNNVRGCTTGITTVGTNTVSANNRT